MTEHLYFSLTKHLLSEAVGEFTQATQSPFLRAAAEGRLDKKTLREWLVNDRKYIHAYIIGAEGMLAELQNSTGGAADEKLDKSEVALATWLTEAVANVRREEQFFIEVAARYGIDLEPRADDAQLDCVLVYKTLFECVPHNRDVTDPWWLDAAVLFWATEICYLEAWSWAKTQLNDQSPGKDADGGALRTEFIPNWSSPEFAAFVDRLAHIIDEAVNKMSEDIEYSKDTATQRTTDVRTRTFVRKTVENPQKLFLKVLETERSFWPKLE
ncbi:hypothetical protein V492_00480 [Pseudogymnoascus sp. VKM F-4246]|nr:hypothetical protein V492_00480 [Pseudogymnoascus sp. VKM F-4246]